jgi:hypothetical protein
MASFTPPTINFEFRVFPADESGVMHTAAEFTEFADLADLTAAKRKAGSLAKANNGPVDLAYADERHPWNERYVTTAAPSEFHKSGYRFERLD